MIWGVWQGGGWKPPSRRIVPTYRRSGSTPIPECLTRQAPNRRTRRCPTTYCTTPTWRAPRSCGQDTHFEPYGPAAKHNGPYRCIWSNISCSGSGSAAHNSTRSADAAWTAANKAACHGGARVSPALRSSACPVLENRIGQTYRIGVRIMPLSCPEGPIKYVPTYRCIDVSTKCSFRH